MRIPSGPAPLPAARLLFPQPWSAAYDREASRREASRVKSAFRRARAEEGSTALVGPMLLMGPRITARAAVSVDAESNSRFLT